MMETLPKLKNIYDLSFEDLNGLLKSWEEPSYRVMQIWEGLYQKYWSLMDEFTAIPKSLRKKLSDYFLSGQQVYDKPLGYQTLKPISKQESSDGETIKTLFSIKGDFLVEAVLMRYKKRQTLCISTQAGCAMGCVFCATGQMGFKRQLSSGEIVEQVVYYARDLARLNEQVTNIVIMGMGEPFHNYDATLTAVDRLNDPRGFNLGARRFTISTVGLIPGIRRFTNERRQVNLAISLHAADDELRSQLLPINKKYPLSELLPACLEYVHTTHRRLSFEWALIQGKNDTTEQANLLAKMLQDFKVGRSILCHVNVIPLNPTKNYLGQASTHQRAISFQKTLEQNGIPCTIRLRRGIDIEAGCGQLAGIYH
jgi:23S rRNA (adenine2503-C2)-methyltransferase